MRAKFLPFAYIVFIYLVFFGRMLHSNTVFNLGKDMMRISYPTRFYMYERLKQGIFPFWTERILSGYPIYADGESGYLNFPNIFLIYILGPTTSFKALHFGAYLIGSYFFIKYLKTKGFSDKASILSHVIYFFNFFSLFHQQHQAITFAYYLLPVFIWSVDKYSSTHKISFLFLWSLTFSYLFYFGAFQMLFIAIFTSILLIVNKNNFSRKLIGHYSFIVLLTFFLCLPFLAVYTNTYRALPRSNGTFNWKEGSLSPISTINLMYPFLYGTPEKYIGDIINPEFNIQETYNYMGITAIILGVLGLLFSGLTKSDNRFLISLLILFCVFGFAKINPIFSVLSPPGFSLFRYWGRLSAVAIFSLSLYAGHFLTLLEKSGFPKIQCANKTNLRFLLFSLPIFMLLSINKDTLNTFYLIKKGECDFGYPLMYAILFLTTLAVIIFVKKRYGLLVYRLNTVLLILCVTDAVLFGNLILKKAFISIAELYTPYPNISSEYDRRRIVLLDSDVKGNKYLYYNFWSLFGASQSADRNYTRHMSDIGFGSTGDVEARDNVPERLKQPNFIKDLESIGVSAVIKKSDTVLYQNSTNSMFYSNDSSSIEETVRQEGYYKLKINSQKPTTIHSYVRYNPEWNLKVNDIPIPVQKEGIFLYFIVPSGKNIIEMDFFPIRLVKYSVITFVSMLVLILVGFKAYRKDI